MTIGPPPKFHGKRDILRNQITDIATKNPIAVTVTTTPTLTDGS